MVIGNQQQRRAGLVSLALHTIAISTIVLLAPGAAVTLDQAPRYRVTTITFTPPRPPAPPVARVKPSITSENPTLPRTAVAAVHTAGFDQNRTTATTTHSANEVIAGKWDTMRASSAPVLYSGAPGPAGLYATGSGTSPRAVTSAASALDAPARLLATPTPRYTDEARQLHVTGEVVLEVLLTADGTVRVRRVVAGLGHGLDDAAIMAVNRTRCRPALRAGQPVDVTAMIHVIFQLA